MLWQAEEPDMEVLKRCSCRTASLFLSLLDDKYTTPMYYTSSVFKYKGSFGSHHLGLESKKLFMILTITCLVATELVMEFI
jgi:hypothetical protein